MIWVARFFDVVYGSFIALKPNLFVPLLIFKSVWLDGIRYQAEFWYVFWGCYGDFCLEFF